MSSTSPRDVTGLLIAWREGDKEALDALVPLVYAELRRLAHGQMRGERRGHLLQTTALVHEAYLRLIDSSRVHWRNRAHFLAVSAQVMRRVLIDTARARGTRKRGGEIAVVPLAEGIDATSERSHDIVALDDALAALARIDARKARVVELRYFGGMTAEESAEVLGISAETVSRDWRLAKMWLLRELEAEPHAAGPRPRE
jgi:RNA polymerase sigma factor (TIGR02999 family)